MPLAAAPSESLAELLQRVFGHREFRAHQREVCEAATAGRDVLLVMPTGAGKSLCYQLPALARRTDAAAREQHSTTALEQGNPAAREHENTAALVISPLIALMDDQAAKLAELGLRVARVHSGLSREDARQGCRDYLAGELDFLFIAPERMRVPGFPEMLARRKPSLIAIDEAHCISAWGHDFRPDYRTLGQHLAALRAGANGAPVMALTATATPEVQRDIVAQLQLREPAVFITGFRRENLAVQAMELSKPQRAEFTARLLKDKAARPAIVYAASRKSAEELAERLNREFPARAYHAGLEPSVRERVQREFLAGKIDVVVATVAFGMGVDKADVRTVVHVALPGSVEAFYQEIGRAGRDGLPSRTVLLYNFGDRKTQEFFLEKNYPAASELDRVARVLGGLPAGELVAIEALQRRLGKAGFALDRETLERVVEKLVAVGVAAMDMNGDVRAADASAGKGRWKASYEAQIAVRRAQIDRMVAFAEGHGCRMTALVEHFGDTTDTRGPCGRCDACRPEAGVGADGSAQAAHTPDATERESLRLILRAIEGRGQSTGKLFTELKICKERSEFDALLEGLARAGLLTIANDTFRAPDGRDVTYRKAVITHEGRTPDDATLATVWIREAAAKSAKARKSKKNSRSAPRSEARQSARTHVSEPRPVRLRTAQAGGPAPAQQREVRAAPAAVVELSAAQAALEERLKQWRREEARQAGLPSFFIFSDTVLRNIVLAGPASLAGLGEVRGVGAEKLERFGAGVVKIVRG